ncbi:hypothetical protein E5163_01750 [Marinicauda algicola]|uniref:Uncharacterized protein n=1 Tax=Marinicauda algicola TaxID=2029849 RepID=A0A4V3RYC4_9PROT|nr:hypothetical protein [Marinicauda algicola]TGY89889.1 hypothetical protein E5163_01750 [Marinicauda algicola]
MILRRVISHFRKQEWTAIGIDFVIVVVGVFIGLQVQDWSEARDDRRREAQIVADLLADIDIDRSQYAAGLRANLRRVSAANASLVGAGLAPVMFDQESPQDNVVDYQFDVAQLPEFPAARMDRAWTEVILGFHPTPSTSTFDALVGAGDIKIIRDRNIVRRIQAYRNLTQSVIEQNNKALSIRESVMIAGARYGLAPFAAMPPEDYFRQTASEPEIAASIRIMATFALFHYGEIRAADAQAAELQDSLRVYLETLE